jgi:hypothetical protein
VLYRMIKKVSVHLTITVQKIPTQLMSWRWPSKNTFWMWTVLYWTRSSITQFGVSINVWRMAGDTLNITCNFLYCNHQVHRDFLITLYKNHVKIIRVPDSYWSILHPNNFDNKISYNEIEWQMLYISTLFTPQRISLYCRQCVPLMLLL